MADGGGQVQLSEEEKLICFLGGCSPELVHSPHCEQWPKGHPAVSRICGGCCSLKPQVLPVLFRDWERCSTKDCLRLPETFISPRGKTLGRQHINSENLGYNTIHVRALHKTCSGKAEAAFASSSTAGSCHQSEGCQHFRGMG